MAQSKVRVIGRRRIGDRDFSSESRKRLAKSGAAMPDGSFPIVTTADLRNAINAVGRASDKAGAKAHIIKRAKALGATKELPDEWNVANDDMNVEDARTHGVLQMFDTAIVDGLRQTADGYLTGYAKIARTGIQSYKGFELRRPDLEDVAMYRPEAEVFHVDAMHSVAHRPITLNHPPEMVDARNWKKYSVGQLGDEVVRDGDFIKVPLVVMDQKAIDAYQKDGVRELSLGYSADIKWGKGTTPGGQMYDAMQTGIRVNHLAIVSEARGGSSLRLGDSGSTKTCSDCGEDMPADADECPECGYTQDSVRDGARGERRMSKTVTTIMVDSIPVEIDEVGAAVVQRTIAKMDAKITKLQDAAAAKKKTDDDDDAQMDAKVAGLQKQVDSLTGENAVLKKQVEDSKLTPEVLDAAVKARSATITAAASVLDKAFVFDGKSKSDIRRAAVAARLGDAAAKALSDGAIEGAFVAITAEAGKGGTQPLRRAIGDANQQHQRSGADPREQAFADQNKYLTEAWRTPGSKAN